MTFVRYWLPVLLWMAMIFGASTETLSEENTVSLVEAVVQFLFPDMSAEGLSLVNKALRKAGHLAEYFVLGYLLLRAFRGGSALRWRWRWAVAAVAIVVMYAAMDEYHQSFVPVRTASAVDVGIDAAGGMAAQALAYWSARRKT